MNNIPKLIQGDCVEVMKTIPSKSIDLILCDLPYGILNKSNENAQWDKPIPFYLLWEQYERIIKDKGAILLFGQGLFFIDLVNSNRKLFRYDLVWDKVNPTGFLNAKRMPLRSHEQIAVFYKSLGTYNPQFTEGKPLHGRGTSYLDKKNINNNYGSFSQTEDIRKGTTQKYPKSILTFTKKHPSTCLHPTEKSQDLLEYLIKTYSNEGDTVLDNCCGSGSTLISASKLGRKSIGIELSDKYFEIAKENIVNNVK